MARKYVDCRESPSVSGCSLRISGEEEELVRAAAEHAVSVHGHTDSAELRQMLRTMMKDEPAMGAARRDSAPSAQRRV
jgi:predicted small metal-binding protein